MKLLQLLLALSLVFCHIKARGVFPNKVQTSEEAFDEYSSYLEADILGDTEIKTKIQAQPTKKTRCQNTRCLKQRKTSLGSYPEPSRMAITENLKLWEGGKVPYILGFNPKDNLYVYDNIMTAISTINELKCVEFYEATYEKDAVRIILGPDYSSQCGKQGGIQDITVSSDNSNIGTILHELMHTLGFGHEHNRPDRDGYIIILWDNIQENAKPYFRKYTGDAGFTNNSLEYDYKSIMHATNQQNPDIFVDINKPIITRIDGALDVGQRAYLTELDKERIRKTYRCDICSNSAQDKLLFRYPGNCQKYYQCSNGQAFAMDCPAELHFNEDGMYCDYPSLANCAK
ncbi:zinc metalloproteinase nas-4-like [Palaemon carinicauda]|uniref:zinc metalloproteinase nas-4-like n=1 Tax=Palaemon carinicauda TaxID=392227 RepID=UPI0035B64098